MTLNSTSLPRDIRPANALWDAEAVLSLGIDLAGIGLAWIDYDQNTIVLDQKSANFFGLEANKMVSRDELHSIIHPEDRPAVIHKVDEVLESGVDGFADVIHRIKRKDGQEFWLRARKHIRFASENGNRLLKPRSGLVAIMDVTELKESERRAKFLMGEMNHRAKNLLSVVQGLARMTQRTGPVETFVDRFISRLSSLSSNQDIVINSPSGDYDLHEVISAQIEPFEMGVKNRLSLTGPSTVINPEAARSIAMAIHELSTNAIKYGALSIQAGHVNISISLNKQEDAFQLAWLEVGGPPVTSNSHKGFGYRVITSMIESETKGEVSYVFDPKGVRWILTSPLSSII